MRVFVFFAVVASLVGGSENAVLDCEYVESNPSFGYYCNVKNHELITSRDDCEITEVKGEHLSGKIDDDVIGFNAYQRTVDFFPRGLTKFLKNIKNIQISKTNLREVTNDDLKEFRQQLEVLYLSHNHIKHVEDDAFKGLEKLKILSLSLNPCTSYNDHAENDHSQLDEIIRRVEAKCKDPKFIPRPTTTSTTDSNTSTTSTTDSTTSTTDSTTSTTDSTTSTTDSTTSTTAIPTTTESSITETTTETTTMPTTNLTPKPTTTNITPTTSTTTSTPTTTQKTTNITEPTTPTQKSTTENPKIAEKNQEISTLTSNLTTTSENLRTDGENQKIKQEILNLKPESSKNLKLKTQNLELFESNQKLKEKSEFEKEIFLKIEQLEGKFSSKLDQVAETFSQKLKKEIILKISSLEGKIEQLERQILEWNQTTLKKAENLSQKCDFSPKCVELDVKFEKMLSKVAEESKKHFKDLKMDQKISITVQEAMVKSNMEKSYANLKKFGDQISTMKNELGIKIEEFCQKLKN